MNAQEEEGDIDLRLLRPGSESTRPGETRTARAADSTTRDGRSSQKRLAFDDEDLVRQYAREFLPSSFGMRGTCLFWCLVRPTLAMRTTSCRNRSTTFTTQNLTATSDYLFGTYIDVVASPKADAGSSRVQDDCQQMPKKKQALGSSKATLLGWPTEFDMIYTSLCLAVVAYLCQQVHHPPEEGTTHRHWVAAVVSMGPLLGAIMLWIWKDRRASW